MKWSASQQTSCHVFPHKMPACNSLPGSQRDDKCAAEDPELQCSAYAPFISGCRDVQLGHPQQATLQQPQANMQLHRLLIPLQPTNNIWKELINEGPNWKHHEGRRRCWQKISKQNRQCDFDSQKPVSWNEHFDKSSSRAILLQMSLTKIAQHLPNEFLWNSPQRAHTYQRVAAGLSGGMNKRIYRRGTLSSLF